MRLFERKKVTRSPLQIWSREACAPCGRATPAGDRIFACAQSAGARRKIGATFALSSSPPTDHRAMEGAKRGINSSLSPVNQRETAPGVEARAGISAAKEICGEHRALAVLAIKFPRPCHGRVVIPAIHFSAGAESQFGRCRMLMNRWPPQPGGHDKLVQILIAAL